MRRRFLNALKQLVVSPETAPPSVVAAVALVPCVVAGLILFELAALEMLAVAIAAGVAAHLAAAFRRLPVAESPLLPALVGVALLGPAAGLAWAAAAALLGATLELARARITPGARLQAGLVACTVVFLVSRGSAAGYVAPGGTALLPEPIRLWQSHGAGAAAIDPIRLYVGNVPGPVFATSMLAVAIGAAWMWNARRLSLLVVLTFLAGALVPVAVQHWAAGYQLLSGPLWFAAALMLADRTRLPASGIGRPLLGLATGLVAVGVRTRGLAIEAAPVTVAAMQLLVAAVQGAGWLNRNREEARARLRSLRAAALVLTRVRPARPPSPES